MYICACVRLILVLVGGNLCVCWTNLGFSGGSANRDCCRTLRQYDTRYALCTRYVCTLYPEIYTYVRTFRRWTHTSDDSYINQLSLVVATATVSLEHVQGFPSCV